MRRRGSAAPARIPRKSLWVVCAMCQSGIIQFGDSMRFQMLCRRHLLSKMTKTQSASPALTMQGRTSHRRRLSVRTRRVSLSASVSIDGLTKATELNGRIGCILSYQQKSGRFRIQLDSNMCLFGVSSRGHWISMLCLQGIVCSQIRDCCRWLVC